MTVTSMFKGYFEKPEAPSRAPGPVISLNSPPAPFEAWAKRLRSLSDDLKGLGRRTENEFLSIGECLMANHTRAGEISRTAPSVAASMSGDEIVADIDGLRAIVDRMNVYLSHAGDDTARAENSLRRIRQLLVEVRGPLKEFKKVVKNLCALGIVTRIESARLGQESGGFETLAESVENLSALIELKSANIASCGKALDAVIGRTLIRIIAHQCELRGRARAILGEADANLVALVGTHDKCAGVAKVLSERSADISRNVGEVVASIQFHDITRQQLEHATEAIDDLVAKLDAAGVGGGQPAVGGQETIDLTGDVCELQAALLGNSRECLMEAVGSIVDNLRGIARNADGIAGEMDEIAGSVDRAGQTVLSAAERGLASVASSLVESAAAGREMVAVIRSFAGTVEEMSAFVNDIEEIGSEIELVAMNAGIKAAHTGDQGAALGVLAESIQRLSADSRCHTAAVSEALRNIRSAAGDLSATSGADDGEGARNSGVAGMLADLDGLLESLVRVNGGIGPLLSRLDESVRALSADIDRIVAEITVHHVVSGVLGDVMAALGEIEAQGRKLTPGGKSARKDVNLQYLAERYTMHGERDIHRAVTGRGAAAPASSSVDTESRTGEPRKGTEQDLGENVWLF